MYAPQFDYHRADSVSQAVQLLGRDPDAKLLAGGHSLIPILKLRLAAPSAVIDIGRIDALKGITESDGTLRIGALTTHTEIASSDLLRAKAAGLSEAAGVIGDPAVRNRGTIGGNVAHADPASDLPAVLSCLGASFVIEGPGGIRSETASRFFQGLMTTSLRDDEVLTAVEVPAAGDGEGSAYVKFAHPASRYAVVGAAAKVTARDGSCTQASVTLSGLMPTPVRALAVEHALVGKPLTESGLSEACSLTSDCLPDDEVLGDVFASAEYRKSVAAVWVRRALAAAAARAA